MAVEHSFANMPHPNANYAMHAPGNSPAHFDGPMPHRPPPSMVTPDMLPPSTSDDFRSPRMAPRPPPMPHNYQSPASPRWDSMPSGSYSVGNSPTSPRFSQNSSGQPRMRSRPTTPAAKHEVFSMISDTRSEPPSRPLTAKSSLGDLRGQQDYSGPGMENFSRPRKSFRQPSVEGPYRTRPVLLPTHSEDASPMFNPSAPLPSPRGPRRPSITSHHSAATWAGGFSSPTTGEFPDGRGQSRVRNTGPPPVSTATRPPFGYNNRIDSTGSGSAYGGAAPWLGGDELRSSFRSQLTASSAPGTANTERSSVLTKDSSSTSIDVHNEGDPDEPSLEDVMGMYEDGFEDDDHSHNHMSHNHIQHQPPHHHQPQTNHLDLDSRHRPISREEFPSRPLSRPLSRPPTSSTPANQASPLIMVDPVEDLPEPRSVMSSNLDAEIRRSKLFFTSPAFMASLSHLSTADNDEDDKDDDKRDSGKSLNSDPSEDATRTSLPHPDSTTANIDSARPGTASLTPQSAKSPNPGLASDYPESCLPPEMSGPAEIEEPGSRDRYGFKKQNQHITQQQYDAWDQGYSEHLTRRKKKWVAYLKENGLMTDPPNRFPPANPKTKRFVRKGIPPEWRGTAWFYYAGGPAILAKCGGLYSKLLDKRAKRSDVEAIERDLHRTFPDNIRFKPPGGQDHASDTDGSDSSQPFQSRADEPPIISSLRRVLFAFSIYNPQIGYCQSLNFIAGLLLLFVDTEEKVFWLLNVITHLYLPGTHDISLEGSKVDLGVLMAEIRDTMPAVWDKIGGELEADPTARPQTGKSLQRHKSRFRRRPRVGVPTERLPPITLCMTAWFMSCFIGTLPIETTLRVWDVFFLEGSKTMFRVALAIFKLNEPEIKAVSDPMEMFGVVQAMPRRMLDANELLEMCFKKRSGFGHLSQGAIEERRKERRELAKAEKEALVNGGSKMLTTGNVLEVDTYVERKGTIFGRRRRDRSKARTAEA